MCVAEALDMTDIVSMLRRMLQSKEPSADVSSIGASEVGLRDYFYTQCGKFATWYFLYVVL